MTTETRRLLRIEVRNAETPIEDKPVWMKNTAHMGENYANMKKLARGKGLHTVCEEAGCPNVYECWQDREATFLIGGDTCTRRCDFCDIATGRPAIMDVLEPRKVAESVRELGLRYATVTSVARDDLADGGAWLNAETIRAIHTLNPSTGVEILVPDFKGDPAAIQQVIDAKPEVFAHNLETVPRIISKIRPAFSYEGSLNVLTQAKQGGMIVKSNLILGMGETDDEILRGDVRPLRCGLRHSDTDAVSASVPQIPSGGPVGEAPEVRGVRQAGERDRFPRSDGRADGAFVVSRRQVVGPRHAKGRTRDSRAPRSYRGRRNCPAGGVIAAGPSEQLKFVSAPVSG